MHTLGPHDYLLVETCSLHITLCNKDSCADVQISITTSKFMPYRTTVTVCQAIHAKRTQPLCWHYVHFFKSYNPVVREVTAET